MTEQEATNVRKYQWKSRDSELTPEDDRAPGRDSYWTNADLAELRRLAAALRAEVQED